MIYLHGNAMMPETWELFDHEIIPVRVIPLAIFKSRKEARSWVIEEIKRRCKAMNRVKDRWMREVQTSKTEEPSKPQ